MIKNPPHQKDAEMLQGASCIEIVLNGNSYTVSEKTPRQTRPLMSDLTRIQPLFQKMAVAVQGCGDNLSSEIQAEMLEAFEPICNFIQKCDPVPAFDNLPTVAESLEYATEIELTNAFKILAEFLTSPFVERLKNAKPKEKKLNAIRP
jgi:hypothetical protein